MPIKLIPINIDEAPESTKKAALSSAPNTNTLPSAAISPMQKIKNKLYDRVEMLNILATIRELKAPQQQVQKSSNTDVLEMIKLLKELNPTSNIKSMAGDFKAMRELMNEVEPKGDDDSEGDFFGSIIKAAMQQIEQGQQVQINSTPRGAGAAGVPRAAVSVAPAVPTTTQQEIIINEEFIDTLISKIPDSYKKGFISMPKAISKGVIKAELKRRGIELPDSDLKHWHEYAYKKIKKS